MDMTSDLTIPVTEARGQLAELVNRVAYSGDHVTLTRHGRPMAVLVSVSDAQRLQETPGETGPLEVRSLPARPAHTPEEVEHRYDIAARTTAPAPRAGPQPGLGTC